MTHFHYLLDMPGRKNRGRKDADSYVEIRMILLVGTVIGGLALAIPAILHAADLNGDNLDDAWETQYGITTNAYASTNLVGWWQMEPNTTNVIIDSSTNQINGALTNFPSSPFGTGLFSNALYFPATGQVNFTTNSALNTAAGQFTFSTWIQSTNLSEPATIANWTDTSTNSWTVGADSAGVAGVTFSDSLGNIQTVAPSTGAIQLYDGSWHQVAVTYDTNQLATVYVDGQSQANGTITNWTSASAASFTMGSPDGISTNQPYALDDTRLYNRALSSDEISQLPVTYSDLNGTGLTVLDDYLEGLNPLATNVVVTSDFASSGLAAYYGTNLPTLTKETGDNQVVAAGTVGATALVVQVTDSSSTPLVGAPVTFALKAGSDGGLSQTSGGATVNSISLVTDGDGSATVYYQADADVLKNNSVTATAVTQAGNVTVCFKEHCGLQDGLASWLNGDVGVTADGSSFVSQWKDESPNTNSAVQATSGIQPQLVTSALGGHSVIRFNGGSTYLAMPTCIADDFTMVVVFRSTLGTGEGPDWFSAGGIVDAETSGVVNDFGMSLDPQGSILTGIGNPDTTIGSTVGGYNDGRGHIATFTRTESTGDFSQFVDSVLQGTQNNGNTSPLSDPPQITIGVTQTLANYFGGDVAEILLFSRNLSTEEQAEIEGFLADKYGIYSPDATWPSAYDTDTQAQIAANGWDKSQADAYVTFTAGTPPLPAAGLLVWLQAGTGVTADGSGNVEQWVDQSPSGHVVSQSDEISPPVLATDSNGNPCLTFNGSQALISADYIPANNDMTIIAVAADNNPGNFSMIAAVGGLSSLSTGQDRSLCDYYGSQDFDLYYAGVSGGADASAGEQVVQSLTYHRSSGAANFYLRGFHNGGGNVTAADLSSGLFIGDSADLVLPFNGTISSVLIYNRVLSDTERNQAEGYLADQYGVYQPNATWFLAYGADVQELISENAWNKTAADAYVAALGGGVAPPVASPFGGHFNSTQTVTVTSSTSDATIYYTTDGTTPTTSSPLIANGDTVTVSATAEYKFMAADGVAANSSVTTAVFQIGDSGSLVAGDSFTMIRKPDGSVWGVGGNWRGQIGDNQANNPAAVPEQVPDLSGVTAVAASGDHALAVTSEGSAWAWGADDVSQGGDGGTSDLLVPTQISGLSNITSVFAGQVNGFAVDTTGNLFSWGDNTNGQLGDGTNDSQSTPEAITAVTGVVKVASSPGFTLVLQSDGTVWAVGKNDEGELGDGTQNSTNIFQQVPGLSNVVDIATGWGHALALCSDGSVWSWGYGYDGELGHGGGGISLYPQKILGLPRAVQVAAVDNKSYVVLADGTMRSFGYNGQGQFGLGSNAPYNLNTPTPPVGVENVMQLAAGISHTVVCTTTGAFYGFGDNSAFKLTRDFTNTAMNSPTEIHDPAWQALTSVFAVNGSTIALKSDGTAWSTGANSGGCLGSGSWEPSQRPIQVAGLTGITKIGGGCAGLAIDGDSNLWVWGGNWDGQLGIGTYDWLNTPTQVTDVSNIVAAAGGDNHVLIAESDGSVWAAGDDSQGELGDGTTTQEPSFIQVVGISDATQVAAGSNTSFILESDGSVLAFGQNDSGQLGLGTTDTVTSPTQITGLPAMVAITAFGNNAMGIDTEGNVWSWGTLGYSDGTPYEQPNVSNVVAVAAGTYHELAIQSDGTLWGVGGNFAGQLGDPSYSDAATFTQFADVAGAVAVGAGYDTTFVVKQDGSLAGFGNCNSGQSAGNLGVSNYTPKVLFGIGMSETAPTIALTAPTTSDPGTMGTAILFQSSASASTGSIAKVDYYLNGVKIGTSTTTGSWDFSWTPTTYGDLTFEAVAVDTAGVAQVSSPVTISVAYTGGTTPTAPTDPTDVTVTAGAPGTVYIGWTNGSGATSILIQQQNSDGSWTTVDTITDPTITSDEIIGLTTGEDYNFRVVESNSVGTASGSGSFSASSPNAPVLTKLGDEQAVAASSFAANPLIVQVKDSAGHALPGVPIAFALGSGSDGGIALSNGGTTSSTQSVTTNALGQATLYYKAADDVLQNNIITATAISGSGNITINFTECCGLSDGLSLWFNADNGITADGSNNVSAWADQSPGQHVTTQGTSGNQPQLVTDGETGVPALSFSGNQWLSCADSLSANGDVTIIAVADATDPTAWVNIASLGINPTSEGTIRGLGYHDSHMIFDVYENAAETGAVPEAGLSAIAEVTYERSSGNVACYLNGSENGTSNVGASDLTPGFVVGAPGFFTYKWSGTISEVLVYNRILTGAERQQAEVFLADKYGVYDPDATWPLAYDSDVQAEIAANHWNKSQADAYVAFITEYPSIPVDGMVLWLKADEGITTDGSGNVSSWTDQGLARNQASQSNSSDRPSVVANDLNGEPAVRFDGVNDYLTTSLSGFGGTELTYFVVTKGSNYQSLIRDQDTSGNYIVYPWSGSQLFIDSNDGGTGSGINSGLVGGSWNVGVARYATSGQMQTYLNGTLVTERSSGSGSLPNPNSSLILGSLWGSSEFSSCDLAEVLIYKRALTDAERQAVDGYLADKYGLYDSYASWPSAYSSDAQALITANQWSKAQIDAYIAFFASSPPVPATGLSLWLKADAGVTTDGDGNVSGWADQGPYGNNAGVSSSNRVSVISSGTGGKPMLHFNGSNWLAIPDAASLRPSQITVLAVAQGNSTATYQTLIGRAYRNTGWWGYPYVSWDMCLFGVNGGNYLRSAVTTGGNLTENNAGNSYDVSQPHIFGWKYDGTAQSVYLTGSLTASTTTTGDLDYGGGPANICIGARSDASPAETVNADVSEILVYDHALSSDDQIQAETYLADKYGLYYPGATWPLAYSSDVQAEITRNQWSKAQADNYVALQSSNPDMLTTGLKLWLKADSGVNQDGSGNVNSWTDQTGNYTVSQSGSVRPTYVASDVNGKPALHFNGGQALYNGSNMGAGANSDMTMIAVCSSYNPGAQQYTIYLGNTGGYANRGLGYYSSRQLFDLSNGNYSLGTGTPPPNNFVTEEWTLASNLSDVTFYRNGVSTGTASMGSVQNLTSGITIGGYNGYGTPWQGDIAEILVYDHQLTSDETAQLYGYLSDKYGFYNANATWPMAYSTDVQAEIVRNQWTKTQADNYVAAQSANPDMLTTGMLLWLKADAGVTADGSGNVSAWADQTGNYNLTQGTTGNSPALVTSDINGKPALHFSGNQWLHDSNSIGAGANADLTMILVASTSSPGSQQYGLWLGATGTGYNRGLGYYNWSQIFDTYNIWTGGGGVPSANSFVVEAVTLSSDRTTATLYQNGTSTATNSSLGGIQHIQPGVSVGTLYGAGYNWNGDIAEALVYDHQLDSDELQQVGVYLADKYGLYNPNATWPLAYSSDVQAQITANQWTKAQADAYVAFLATLAAWESAHSDIVAHGLTVWLKADADVTSDGSGKVSAWADQTPYANNANQSNGSYQPSLVTNVINAKPVVRFNGSSYLSVTDNSSVRPNSGVTVIAVAQASGGGYQDIVAKGLTHGHWPGYTDPPYYAYVLGTGGNDVEHAYVATNPSEVGNDLYSGVGQYHQQTIRTLVYDGTATTPVQSIYAAGSLLAQLNPSGATIDYQDGNERDLLVGATVAYSGIQNYFSGDVAEVLVYNRALSSAEQQEMEVYLADKYALYHPDATWPLAYSSDVQALIATNQWSKVQADAYVAFAAANTDVPSSGLTVWLRADAGVTADGSGKVSAWADQSIFLNNANQGTSGNQPTLVASALNGKPIIRFSGGQFLDVTDAASIRPNSGVTVIALAQTSGTGYQDIVAKGLSHGHWPGYTDPPYYAYDLGTGNTDVDHAYVATNPSETGNDLYGGTSHGYQQTIRTLVYDGTASTPIQSIYAAGALLVQQNAAGATLDYQDSGQRDLLIGATTSYTGVGNYFNGDVAEVLVYNRALNSTEQQQAEVYLADKYGVYHPDATWPLAYGGDVQAQITANQWSKAQADAYVTFAGSNTDLPTLGMTVWLKADSGVTADGTGKVSQWTDQSIYHNDAHQGTSGNQPTLVADALNGEPMLHFDGGSSFMSVTDRPSLRPGSSGVTVIVVAQADGTGYQDIIAKYLTHTTWGWDWNSPFYSYQLGTGNNDVGRSYITTNPSVAGSDLYAGISQEHQTIIRAMVYNGTTQSLYHSGTLDGTNSVTGTIYNDNNNERDLYIGASGAVPGGTVNYFNGSVAEVMVYNRALTSIELQQAQVYLADKYGVYHPDATWPLAYSTDVQAEIATNQWTKAQADAFVTFEGTSPAVTADGLALWLRADTGVTADGSGNVSQWSDQTINHNDANQGTSGNRPTLVTNALNGKPVVRFNGSSSFLDVTETASLRPSSGVTVLVVAQTHGAGYQDIVSQALTHTTWGWDWNSPFYSYELGTGNNDIERGYTTTNPSPTGSDLYAPTGDANQMDIMTLVYDGAHGRQQIYRRGLAQALVGVGSTLNYQDASRRDLYLGASGPSPGGMVNYLNGDVAEVLIYNRALSADEQQAAEGYLADEYGLYAPGATWPEAYSTEVQAEIAINQWTQAQADNYVALQTNNLTVLTHGLVLWLKADDGVTADGSNNVSAWADQTGNYTVTQGTSGSKPTLVASDINGKPALHFNGSQSLAEAISMGAGINHDLTVLTVAMTTSPGSLQNTIYLGNGASGQSRGLGYYQGLQLADFSGTFAGGSAAPASGAFVTEAFTLDSTLQNAVLYRNGIASGSGRPVGDELQAVTSGIMVGNRSDAAAPWQGDIAEVLVFDHQLNTTEMNEIGGYLADKYGTYNPNATWFASYSNDVKARIIAYQWSKAQADAYVAAHGSTPTMVSSGLAAWFKADAGITKDGSNNVSAWADQTSTYTLSQTGTAQPTFVASDINGKPALRLNGSQWLASTSTISGINADCTIIAVGATSSPSTQQYSVYLGSGSGSGYENRAIGYSSSQEFYDTAGSSSVAGQAPSTSAFVTEIATLDSGLTNVTFYQNGNQTGTGTLSSLANLSAGIAVGAAPDPAHYWQGDIAEVIVYDHKLSTSDLQQVDGYLADKYGLFDPNATWPSAYSEAVEIEIFKRQWTKAQADAYVAMQSANPSTPTDGLALWLKADAGVTQDGSGNVTAIADQTGNYTLTQGTSANEPTYVASDLNGKPAIRFSGTQWLADTADAVSGLNGDMTIITVGMSSTPGSSAYTIYMGQSGGANGVVRAAGYSDGCELFDTYPGIEGVAAPDASTFLMEATSLDSTLKNVTFYQNGVSTAAGTLNGVQNLASHITMGAADGGSSGWQGDIAEVLVYDHQLTDAEMQQVEVYLTNKYDLAGNGPAPAINPNGGSYTSTQTVTISTSQTGGTLHYTIDGTTPTVTSPTYTSSISISGSALVQAQVFSATGQAQSQVGSAQFYINDSGQTGLPPAPTGLAVTPVSWGENDLAWSLGSFQSYNQIYVYRSTNGGSYELIAVLSPTDISFVDTTVTPGNTYSYEVGTVNQSGVKITAGSSAITPSANGPLGITLTTPAGATELP